MIQLVRFITFKPEAGTPALLWEHPTYVGSPPKVDHYNPRGEAGCRASILVAENRGKSKMPNKVGVMRLITDHVKSSGDGSDLDLGKLTATGVLETVEAGWTEYLDAADQVARQLVGTTLECKFVEFMTLNPEGTSQLIHVGLYVKSKCPAENEAGHRMYIAHAYFLVATNDGVEAALQELPTFANTYQSATRFLHLDGATSPIGIPPTLKLLSLKQLPKAIPVAPAEKNDDEVEI